MVLTVLLGLWAAPDGLAFYNPETGRWLSRDPMGEPGFELVRGKTPSVLAGGPNRYLFVQNNSISQWDYLGLDNPGCDLPGWLTPGWNRDCFLRCCAIHDMCYYHKRFKDGRPCTSASWLQLLNPCSWCGKCNREVVGCFIGCLLGLDTSPGPMWFCANGPNAGTMYYNWDSIPASCWQDGQKPENP
jgi:RHS repeat-associated protein